MKRILHLSDLHFGRVNLPALEALRQTVIEQQKGIDLIIVTGDWTQRARAQEFEEAADFVKGLTCPVLSVPGNHDVPLYDIGRRIFAPYSRYAKLRPLTLSDYQDQTLSVLGVSTVNPYRVIAGVMREIDLARANDFFAAAPAGALKIIACHHPIYDPRTREWLAPESRSQKLLLSKPDIILSGHSHLQWAEVTEVDGRQVLHISAGTSISSRTREEVNSFHILEIDAKGERSQTNVTVKTYDLRDQGFLERGLPSKTFQF